LGKAVATQNPKSKKKRYSKTKHFLLSFFTKLILFFTPVGQTKSFRLYCSHKMLFVLKRLFFHNLPSALRGMFFVLNTAPAALTLPR
jgi:hypothetical protein